MTTYLVETYLPAQANLDDVEGHATRAAQSITLAGAAVRLERCIHITEDETCFMLFEAESEAAVRQATEHAGLAPQRIVEAVDTSLAK